jgi:hypothetical protein
MKFKIIFILLGTLFIFVFLSFRNVYSQTTTSGNEFDYKKAYQDYLYNSDLYNKAYTNYVSQKAQYSQIKTLAAKDSARDATYKMLTARDDVVKTYLTAIRMKIKENSGIPDNEKENYYNQIDPEFSWFSDHKSKIPSAGSLDDLVTDSDTAKSHYEGTKLLIYQSLNGNGIGKTSGARQRMTTAISDLRSKIAEIRANEDKDVSFTERSLVDVENKLKRSEEKETKAKSLISSMKKGNTNNTSIFGDAQKNITDSYLYLKEANTNLKEIVKQIMTE